MVAERALELAAAEGHWVILQVGKILKIAIASLSNFILSPSLSPLPLCFSPSRTFILLPDG